MCVRYFKLFILFLTWASKTCGEADDVYMLSNYNKTENNFTEIMNRFVDKYPVKLWIDHGYFTIQYLEKINVHWLKFPPQAKQMHYVLAVVYFFIMVIGFSGNFLVILMYFRCKTLKTPANTLVANLAVSDMLMMVKMPIFIYNSFYMGPALGDFACRFYGFIGGLSGTCSICTLSVISLNRYYAVKFPLNMRFTGLRAKICVIISWTYAITFSTIPLLDIGLGTYVPEGFLTSCSFDYLTEDLNARLFILAFFAAAWVFPLGIITFAYTNILKVVIDSNKIAKHSNPDSIRHMRRRQEIRLSLIVVSVIILWFVAWTPYATVSLLGITGQGHLISPLTSMIPALFAKTASCVEPFVYALMHPKFKKELRAMFCKRREQQRRGGIQMSTLQSGDRPLTRRKNYRANEESSMLGVRAINSPNKKIDFGDKSVVIEKGMQEEQSTYKACWWFPTNLSYRSSSLQGLANREGGSTRKSEETKLSQSV